VYKTRRTIVDNNNICTGKHRLYDVPHNHRIYLWHVFGGSPVPEFGVSLHVKDSIFEIAGFRETDPRLRHPNDKAMPLYTPLPTSLISTIDILSATCRGAPFTHSHLLRPGLSVQRHAFVLEYIHQWGRHHCSSWGHHHGESKRLWLWTQREREDDQRSEHKPVCRRY
jgi:hypothetical protein